MPIGPGRYDDLCTLVRERTQAKGVMLIVFGGHAGDGFSAQLSVVDTLLIPSVLRKVADEIEQSYQGKPT